MNGKFLLRNSAASRLYEKVKDLPIVDYHSHLSPKEIYEDKPFSDIGELWLGKDHYKWRLMRGCGIDERFITGDAPMREKFKKYAEALTYAVGHPLYHWSHMELSAYFGINEALTAESADDIWDRANRVIAEKQLSPRKLIKGSGVEVVCTTDDILDDLEYHKLLAKDETLDVKVLPSFRTDNLFLIKRREFSGYLEKLASLTGISVGSLTGLKAAVRARLEYFAENGCRFTDVGIPAFPDRVYSEKRASSVYAELMAGKLITDEDYLGLLGNLYRFLGGLYREKGLVMQWHLAVYRNANTKLFSSAGADCGVDCVGDTVSGAALITVLDAIERDGGLPNTLVYSLNAANMAQIASIAGAFPNVKCGAAWWFCDHRRGIEEQLKVISEYGSIGEFTGMLTDSRSFLSYARHDYFRLIACSVLGEAMESGECGEELAERIAERICYANAKKLF